MIYPAELQTLGGEEDQQRMVGQNRADGPALIKSLRLMIEAASECMEFPVPPLVNKQELLVRGGREPSRSAVSHITKL